MHWLGPEFKVGPNENLIKLRKIKVFFVSDKHTYCVTYIHRVLLLKATFYLGIQIHLKNQRKS